MDDLPDMVPSRALHMKSSTARHSSAYGGVWGLNSNFGNCTSHALLDIVAVTNVQENM